MNNKKKNQLNNSPSPAQNKQSSPIISSRTYYFTNCIYNGLIKSMRKVGTGVILFHDGMCAIVSYNNSEEFHGLSVFYRSRCMISIQYVRNRIVSIMYRIDGFLLFLNYNQHSKIHGDCYIINFIERSIYQVHYHEGYLKSKVKMLSIQKVSVDNLFNNQAYHLIVGHLHNKVLRHQVSPQNISNIRMKKIGNKVLVHYMQNTHDKLAQGLGFQFIYRAPENGGYDPQTNRFKDEFQLNIIQKGMYKDNMLQGYGHKIFKNNNIYQGFFSGNVFNGQGCLKNTHKGSWVYGVFSNGQMRQIIDFNNQANDQVRSQILLQNLRQSQPNFISQMIQQNTFDFLDYQLQKISAQSNLQQFRNETFQQRKQQIMKKIAEQFTQIQYTNKVSIQEQARNYQISKKILGKNTKQQQQLHQNQKTQRKTPHIIHSLVPESLGNIKFNIPQPAPSNRFFEQQTRFMLKEKQALQKTVNTKVESSHKKLGRIFHKSYSHLQQQDKEKIKKQQQLNNIQNKGKSRIRKSHIFTNKEMENLAKSDISLGAPSPSTERMRLNSNTPYKRRSTQRKTKIFNSTLKLKKINNTDPKATQNEEDLGITRLQSIRKGSLQKKSISKIKNKKSITIFDEQDEKSAEVVGKFVYSYQKNSQQVNKSSNIKDNSKNQLKKTIKSPKNLSKTTRL